MACASASASLTELMSKRKTRSPPYLARSVGGGLARVDALPFSLVKPEWMGLGQMLLMRLSRARDSHDLALAL